MPPPGNSCRSWPPQMGKDLRLHDPPTISPIRPTWDIQLRREQARFLRRPPRPRILTLLRNAYSQKLSLPDQEKPPTSTRSSSRSRTKARPRPRRPVEALYPFRRRQESRPPSAPWSTGRSPSAPRPSTISTSSPASTLAFKPGPRRPRRRRDQDHRRTARRRGRFPPTCAPRCRARRCCSATTRPRPDRA